MPNFTSLLIDKRPSLVSDRSGCLVRLLPGAERVPRLPPNR